MPILPPEAPRIRVTQQAIHVSAGADAVLECQATGAPPPLVRWFKGRSRSTQYISYTKLSEGTHIGTFYLCFQVSLRWFPHHLLGRTFTTGTFTFKGCERSMPAGTLARPAALLALPLVQSFWRLEVSLHFSVPTRSWRSLLNVYRGRFSHPFTVGPLFSEAPVDLMANIGENVTLPCAARGSPQPTVTWHRQDGGRILTGGHSRTVQLENGHLLIQGEFSMKHYHSRALASAAVCYGSVLPPTRWDDWDFTVWQTPCLSFYSFGHQYAEFCRCFEAAPV